MAIDKVMLRLTAHQKLIYNITRQTRAVFMALRNTDTKLVFRAYFSEEPTLHERDLISDAASETAVEFPEILEWQAECFASSNPFSELEKLDYWLFVRAEEIDAESLIRRPPNSPGP